MYRSQSVYIIIGDKQGENIFDAIIEEDNSTYDMADECYAIAGLFQTD